MMTRGFTVAWTASLLVAGAFVVLSGQNSRAQAPGSSCEDAAQLGVLPSPLAPWKGAPLRVIFAAEKPLQGEFSLIAPDGSVAADHARPPGRTAVFLVRRGRDAGCGRVARKARARGRAGRMHHHQP